MTTIEELRAEEYTAIEQERLAFERHQTAWLAVHRQFLPFGNGVPTSESLVEFEVAERAWRAAKAEVGRITEEIRTGRRR